MTTRQRARLGLVLLLAATIGCRAAAPTAAPAAPALPTSAAVGGTSIVAIAPPAQACCPKQTLPQFLGITGLFGGVGKLLGRLRNRLGSIFPGLEAKPEILALTDPANLASPNPAVAAAAGIKAEEDGAAQKAKAIAYLASVGCAGCYPGIEDALLAALDDCTELVRFETAKALRSTAAMPCKNCCRSACCGPKLRDKLEKMAYEHDPQGCYVESSDRVRRMARLALANCTCVPLKPGQEPRLPAEGPGAEAEAPSAATASATRGELGDGRSVLAAAAVPVGSGVAVAASTGVTAATVQQVGYEQALRAYGGAGEAIQRATQEVAWEVWTARPVDFRSRHDALAAMALARTQLLSSQPGQFLPPQLQRRPQDWTDPSRMTSPALAHAVATTPVGGVSGVVEDASGWYLVRVLARRPAPHPTPAPVVQPVAYFPPAGNVPLATAVPWPAPNCNCK
jgi:PPIC-type PPIASE domain